MSFGKIALSQVVLSQVEPGDRGKSMLWVLVQQGLEKRDALLESPRREQCLGALVK